MEERYLPHARVRVRVTGYGLRVTGYELGLRLTAYGLGFKLWLGLGLGY